MSNINNTQTGRTAPNTQPAAMSDVKPSPTQCVGPDYRSESQKPTAVVSVGVEFDTVTILPQTPQLIALLS